MIKKLDKEIVSEVLINNYAYKMIWNLCDYGTRFAGSEGEKLARQYIIDKLKSYGLSPETEKFEHLGWKRGWAKLKTTKPFERELHTISLCGGPSTIKGGLEGEIVSVGHGTPFEDATGNWWMVFHGYENGHYNMGRQTLLQPIEWTNDGWYKTLDDIKTDETIKRPIGIVTDEGGMLCHASIISREMNIPCIVGCKTATQILQDNEMIELNADEGIVKKLK